MSKKHEQEGLTLCFTDGCKHHTTGELTIESLMEDGLVRSDAEFIVNFIKEKREESMERTEK